MSITELSIKRPILVVVLFTVLSLLGIFSYFQLRYELLPKITPPFVSVLTFYPGAAPSEVETAITKPIEEAVSSLDKIKRVNSISSESVSLVFVEFQQAADPDKSLQDAQRKVNEMVALLPNGAKSPSLSKFDLSELPVLQLSATSKLPPREFFTMLKDDIKPRLAQIAGVGQVVFVGGDEREIRVSLDAEKLRLRGVSVLQIVDALRRANVNVPAGNVKDADAQFSVRVAGKASSGKALGEIIIATTPDGARLKLADVATIADTQKETETFSRLNTVSAVGILIQKQSGANTVEVSELVRAQLAKLEAEFSAQGVKFDVAQDGSEFTLKAAYEVNVDLGLAILLVAAVMLVFLHSFRNALIVMVSIPASLLSTFVFMYLLGFTLNLMTLLAMSLVVGILVDDSIVVLENIYVHLERGKSTRAAALDGRNEIGFAALAITLVDVVVFLPLSLVSGLVGNIVREFALVVVISTLFSLLVSFTLTPMMASRFAKVEHLSSASLRGRFGGWFERLYARLVERYLVVLRWSLQHRKTVATVAFVLFIGSMMLPALGFVGSEFAPATDKGELQVVVELPAGSKLEETDRAAQQMEQAMKRIPEVRKVLTSVGSSSNGFTGTTDPTNMQFTVTLAPKNERTRGITAVAADIKARGLGIPGAKVRTSPVGIFGTGNDAPIQIMVSGTNRDSIRHAARMIVDSLNAIAGTADVRVTGETLKPEMQITVDREKLASYALSTEEVGMTVRTALAGFDDLKLQTTGVRNEQGGEQSGRGETTIPIRVLFDDEHRTSTDALGNLPLINQRGQRLELRQVARVERSAGYASLERKDRANSVTVFSQAVDRPSGDIGVELQRAVKAAPIPLGVSITYAGDLELQDDSFGKLGLALLAAIVFMYLVMVALYNSWVYPFIVLFSIPVAIVGALVAMALAGKSLSIFSIFGIIMMTGLVAKNAILLVERTNQARSEGKPVFDALMDAGESRLRPILMTTLAMVIGMLPIALSSGSGGEFKSGLGWALIGGLTSSMLLTLVVVPTVYMDVDKLRSAFMRLVGRFRQSKASAPSPDNSASNSSANNSEKSRTNGTAKTVQHASTLAIAFALLTSLAFAQQPPSSLQLSALKLSVRDAVGLAEERNPELQIAQLEQTKADERRREAFSGFLPNVSGQAQYIRNIQAPVFFFPASILKIGDVIQAVLAGQQPPATEGGDALVPLRAGLANSYTVTVNASVPLYQAELTHGLRAAELGQTLAAESYAASRLQKRRDVQAAYYNALLAREQETLLQQSIARAEETLDYVRAQIAKGLVAETDTLRAFVAVENLRPQRTKVANAIAIARAALAVQLGLREGEAFELVDSFPSLAAKAQSADVSNGSSLNNASFDKTLLDNALLARPDVKQLALRRDLAETDISLNWAGHLPSVAVFGQYQLTSQSDNFNFARQVFPNSSYLGLQISVPMFSGFRIDARVQQAKIAHEQAELQLSYTKNLVRTEINLAHASAQEAQQRMKAQRATIAAAERSYQAARSRYKQGLLRQLEVSEADLALTQAKANYAQAVYEFLIARADLERAVGIVN